MSLLKVGGPHYKKPLRWLGECFCLWVFLSVVFRFVAVFRDERVKHKVLRIFKIWEQRGIYNEEFIADLSGLISATPAKKSDDPHEFQVNGFALCTFACLILLFVGVLFN